MVTVITKKLPENWAIRLFYFYNRSRIEPNFRHGGHRSGNKNGGLKVHNYSIASRAMGDAAWATENGGVESTKTVSRLGRGGTPTKTEIRGGLNVRINQQSKLT